MRNGTYTARRRELNAQSFSTTASWGRNRNTVRHASKALGTTSFVVITSLLVLIVGLIYVTQGTRATSYDYKLSNREAEIDELEAKREDLAVEKARLTAIATSEKSRVAANMADSGAASHANL